MKIAFLAITIFAFAGLAHSQEQQPPAKGAPPPPPAEALEACAQKAEGDACSFAPQGREQMEGKCMAPPGKPKACRPDNPPPQQ
jgi:hypothetical protein